MNEENNNSHDTRDTRDTAIYKAIKRLAIPESLMPVKDIPELLVENRRICMEMAKQVMQQMAMLATYFGVPLMEIIFNSIKAFESTAKKYGIDFALKKDTTESPPRYLVFFKGRDADVLTAAFKEFSAKKLTQEKKPSIRKLLSTLKEAAQGRNAERAKVKNKDREVSL